MSRAGLSLVATAALAAWSMAVEPGHAADREGSAAMAHWAYDGDAGPSHWANLAPENAACATGGQQSPIDLSGAVPAAVAAPVITWGPSSAVLHDNGHTWQLDFNDAGGLMHGDKVYLLLQAHFHHAAEHTVGGVRHPLEIHFVHQSAAGDLAVVAVLVREGEPNGALGRLWRRAPEPGAPQRLSSVDPRALLPLHDDQLHYAGSLTTPPCSEIVTWTVFAHPIEAAAEQIDAFAARYAANYRPIQPRNRRFLLSTR